MSPENISQLEKSQPQFETLADQLEAARLAPAGTPETTGATPLNHQAAYPQQRFILSELQQMLDANEAENIPAEVVEYIKNTFEARFNGRSVANYENYFSALHSREEFADDGLLQEAIDRAEVGQATPAELMIIRSVLGIRSVELACLTHPYGTRLRPHLETMRNHVMKNVELMGGEYFQEPETRYRVKACVGEFGVQGDCSKGLLMTRKRTLGVLPDGTVIRERSSFVLRTDDPSIIPAEVIAQLNQLDMQAPDWQDKAVEVGQLDKIVQALLEDDLFDLAIPISTTIYAYNQEMTTLIEERDEQLRQERRNELEDELQTSYPHLHAALQEARQKRAHPDLPHATDIDGMLYVNRYDS